MKINASWGLAVMTPLFLSTAGVATANSLTDEAERAGKFEGFAVGTYLWGDEAEVQAPPGSSNFKQTVNYATFYGAGLGVGYNFTDHFNLSFALNFGEADTEVTTSGSRGGRSGAGAAATPSYWNENCFMMGGELIADYNIFRSRLTPILEGGFGMRGVWDVARVKEPLWNDHDDVSSVDAFFTISGGAGLRWDITDRWFVKAVYKVGFFVALNNDLNDDLFVHGATLSVGYTF